MKRFSYSLVAALAAMICFISLHSCADPSRSHILKIYNWATYMDEALVPEFEDWYYEQTGEKVKVIYEIFDINDVMYSKIKYGHEDYDMVCPSDYMIERMLQNDLLLPIEKDFGDIPNYIDGNMSPVMKNALAVLDGNGHNSNDYIVGYMWGTAGFLYNTRHVTKEDVSTWNALANPRFEGKIFMKDAFRDVYFPLLTFLRHDEIVSGAVTYDEIMRDASDESIALVEEYLKSVKKNISGWEVDFGKEEMTKEKAWLNLTWSGEACWSIQEAALVGVPLDYDVPMEGSQIWFDGWVIPKYAKNVKAASYFINFLCMPENAVRNMDVTGYVSVINGDYILENQIDTAFPPVDVSYFFGPDADSVCINPCLYPDKSVIERCHVIHDSGDRTQSLLEMWARVKGDNASALSYVIVVIFFGVLITSAILSIHRKRVIARLKRKKHR